MNINNLILHGHMNRNFDRGVHVAAIIDITTVEMIIVGKSAAS